LRRARRLWPAGVPRERRGGLERFCRPETTRRAAQSEERAVMTHSIPRASAIALGVAAVVSLSSLSARADDTAAPGAATPSLAEPAPTPSWSESGPRGPTAAQHPMAR